MSDMRQCRIHTPQVAIIASKNARLHLLSRLACCRVFNDTLERPVCCSDPRIRTSTNRTYGCRPINRFPFVRPGHLFLCDEPVLAPNNRDLGPKGSGSVVPERNPRQPSAARRLADARKLSIPDRRNRHIAVPKGRSTFLRHRSRVHRRAEEVTEFRSV